jgi:hypothetical protein
MRATRLLLALPLALALVVSNCGSDTVVGLDETSGEGGHLAASSDTCDPNYLPC